MVSGPVSAGIGLPDEPTTVRSDYESIRAGLRSFHTGRLLVLRAYDLAVQSNMALETKPWLHITKHSVSNCDPLLVR